MNASACLNRGELAELAANFTQRQEEVALREPPKEAASHVVGAGTGVGPPRAGSAATIGDKAGRPLLVKPPQLPVEDPTALGARDEDDIALLQEFFVKVLATSHALSCVGA